MTDLRPEHELLLCIARKTLDDRLSRRLRTLAGTNLDWDHLVKTAANHRLLPLLYTQLKAHCPENVPQPVLEELKTDFLDNSRCSLYLVRELLSTLSRFQSHGLKALTFKGPVLGAMVYGDLGLRSAGDLDILIERRDFVRAKDILQSAGYQMEPQLSQSQQTAHLSFHCEIQFFQEHQVSVIDLHWELTPQNFPTNLDPLGVFSRSKKISLGGKDVATFGNEDLLLYLCMHGAKHYWSRLEWIASIAELMRGEEELDWKLILQLARKAKAEVMLRLGLILARDLFAIEIPLTALETIPGKRNLEQHARQIEEELFRERATLLSQWEMFRLNLQFMDRKRDAVLGLARSLLTPTISDWRMVTLPASLYPLYYLLRPLRLMAKYGSGQARRQD